MRRPPVPSAATLFDQAARLTPGQASHAINEELERIVRGFPNFDSLDPFTTEMTRALIDRDDVKQALGRVHGAQRMIARMTSMKKGEFLGRFKSMMKRLDKAFEILGAAREALIRLPDPTIHFTVCLAGFPNAGKSTMLKTLTGANAEIAAYEFTTKTLNYGTTEIGHLEVQFVDTPGTLNRAFSNPVEKQALLALQHLAKAIVFVYDPLRDDEEQEKLFDAMFAYKLPLAIYAAKQDIEPKLPVFARAKKWATPIFTKPEELVTWIEPQVRIILKKAVAEIKTEGMAPDVTEKKIKKAIRKRS